MVFFKLMLPRHLFFIPRLLLHTPRLLLHTPRLLLLTPRLLLLIAILVFSSFSFTGCAATGSAGSHKASLNDQDSFHKDLHFFEPVKSEPQELSDDQHPEDERSQIKRFQKLAAEPLQPEETSELIDTASGNFFYGPGLGETAVDVAGVIAFPPYALAIAGNTVLSLTGFSPIRITNIMPESVEKPYESVTQTIYSGPGRVVSNVSGSEYLDKEDIKGRWDDFISRVEKNRELRANSDIQPIAPRLYPEIPPKFFTDD